MKETTLFSYVTEVGFKSLRFFCALSLRIQCTNPLIHAILAIVVRYFMNPLHEGSSRGRCVEEL